jgi:TetR/AcrR family transcriptional repressor of nem operon
LVYFCKIKKSNTMGKAERTRQFIIEQAAPIFNEKGIAGTSMSDIMNATKMAKGGLYGHFESKEEMSVAVVEHLMDSMGAKLQSVVLKEKTAKGKLFAFLDFYRNPLKPYCQGGCPMVNFGVEADDTNPELKAKIGQRMLGSEQFIAGIVKEGIVANEFTADFDAEVFGIKMFALIEGGSLISRVLGHNKRMVVLVDALKAEIEAHKKE